MEVQNTGPKPWNPVVSAPVELNEWQTGLCDSCCADPGKYLTSCFCSCCAAYSQRMEILQHNLDDYVCCNGVCFGDKVPCQHDCPGCCMIIEHFCCLNCAIHGSRDYLLEKYWIKDSYMEKCFLHCCSGANTLEVDIPCKDCVQPCARCASDCIPCCPEGADNCDCLPENCDLKIPFDCVSACFITQQAHEMKLRGYPNDLIGTGQAPGSPPSGGQALGKGHGQGHAYGTQNNAPAGAAPM
eukprot:GCRY01001431.1.p1 GENE.GCRY01001431.1~~GCRY01001431.1.p1  ORF type:complete len:241 (-),score=39.44 GCRY01001431.1:192-914(-)